MDKKLLIFREKKIAILVITFLVFLSIGVVEARLGNFERRQCVDIKTILNTSTVNISTINYPNTSLALSNQLMEKNGKTFNFSFCDTETIGIYIYDYFDAEGNVFVNDFVITPIGDDITTSTSILYIIILFPIIAFFILFLILAIKSPYGNLGEFAGDSFMVKKITFSKYVKLFSIWLSYKMFMWIITIITGMTNNYIKFEELKILTTNLYLFLNVIGYGLSIAIIWFIFYNVWKDILFNKTILREGKAIITKF